MTTADSGFQTIDWLVLAGYFALLLVSGLIINRKQSGTDDYFLAERRMPAWAVSISVTATALSAATFIGAPQQAYVGDLTYLSSNIGALLAVTIVAVFFIPAFYRHNVSTIYELLERRFGPTARLAASWMFMIGRIFASGARIFIAALPAALILFGTTEPRHLIVAIVALVAVGIAYTLVGGIASVIWTDVIQTFVFVGAAVVAIGVLLHRIPIDLGEILGLLGTAGPDGTSKLTVFVPGLDFSQPGWGFDPSQSYTILTAILGFTLLNMGAYGTDQDMAQRMLTCRSALRGSLSAFCAILVSIPITMLFMLIGLLLFVFYQRPEVLGAAGPAAGIDDTRKIFLTFIIQEMPAGLRGLMMAGLFAAGLSSLNSAINAMASAFVNDFYKGARPNRDDAHYLLVGRLAVVTWGLLLGGFACICVFWQEGSGKTLLDFALLVMVFAYSGLLAVFLTALFTKRGNSASVVAALATGFVTVLVMQPHVWSALGLGKITLAFPWKMTVATALAFLVCCLGRPPESQATPPARSSRLAPAPQRTRQDRDVHLRARRECHFRPVSRGPRSRRSARNEHPLSRSLPLAGKSSSDQG